jgi:hypothetical protein
MKKALAIAVLCIAFCGASFAVPTAGTLNTSCQSFIKGTDLTSPELIGYGACSGYLHGWFDAFDGSLDGEGNSVVFAPGITAGQMARVFVAYVTKHPEQENQPASIVLVNAMIDAKLVTLAKLPKSIVPKEQ